jgi:hypothetical protein
MWQSMLRFGADPDEAYRFAPRAPLRLDTPVLHVAFRRLWHWLLLAGLLGGCAVVDTIDPRIDLTNRQTARARDQAILLNIVRANHNLPLNFVAFSRVSGTQSAAVSLASPTFLLGPGAAVTSIAKQEAIFSNTTLNTSGATNNAFDLTVLDSKDFYNALLSPVDVPTIAFFIRQGYPRELLFWLVVDSVRIRIADKRFELRNFPGLYRYDSYNPDCTTPLTPYLPEVQCFDDIIDEVLLSGLAGETKTVPRASNERGSGNSAEEKRSGPTIYGRLCLDPYFAARARREYPEPLQQKLLAKTPPVGAECGSPTWNPEKEQKIRGHTDTLSFVYPKTPFGPVHYEVITRSTFGIYQFLGAILHHGAMDDVRIRGRIGYEEDRRILAVTTSPSLEPCFVELKFEEHEYFCVPSKGAENTKRIFSMLVQLIALKTQASDLAITPLVRITP